MSSDESFVYEDETDSNSFIDDNDYEESNDFYREIENSIEIIEYQNDQNLNQSDIEIEDNQIQSIDENVVDDNQMEEEVSEEVIEEVVEIVPKTETKTGTETEPKSVALNQSVVNSQSLENGDNCCIICTEMWTTTADHQLVSLSCGHLFGRSCIERWLQPSRRTQRCPQCNKSAKNKDIRVIYARNLRSLDTSERDRALQLLETERQKRKRLESEAIENSLKLKAVLKENERLKQEYMECKLKVQQMSSTSRITEKVISDKTIKSLNNKSDLFEHIKDIEIHSSGDCRLLGYSSLFEVIAVSQPNTNTQLFPGFGVKKVFLNDLTKTDNICIHSKSIKDLEMNAYDGTILTTSLDKSVRLTSLLSKSLIMSFDLEVEAWSVAFNPKNKHEFYAGLRNGQILLFDTRMMSRPVDHLNASINSPVVSLNHIDYESPVGSISGILSTQIHTFSFYERLVKSDNITSDNFSMINIPFEGRFSSAHFENKSGLALLSCRPSTKHQNVTHYVMDLSVKANDESQRSINPNVIEVFKGGTEQVQLSRSRIFSHPFNENSALICAGDESSKGALIWDLSSGTCLQKLKSDLPVLDMSLLHNINTNCYFMTALNGKSLKIYKCIS